MGMENNSKVRARFSIKDIIREAYITLAYKNEVPWQRKDGTTYMPTWDVGYDDPEKKEGMYVEYFLKEVEEKAPQPKKEYEAGDWRDEELRDDR